MSREAFVNGEYTEYNKSYIHIEDRGYQFADGVYEVFAILDGKIVDYKGHIDRLYRSLNELRITSPIQKKSYKFHIKEIIKRNIIKDGMIPKVNTAIESIEKGVRAVVILDGSIQNACLLELFTDHGVGTLIREEMN